MLQFDHLSRDDADSAASIEGEGWLVGPYFVAKSKQYPLFLEGRLLYGQTYNSVSPFGAYEDDFDTERWLAQLELSGEIKTPSVTWYPLIDISYTSDEQHAYTDSLGNRIGSQRISLTQLSMGADFEASVPVRKGKMDLIGSLQGVWSETDASSAAQNTITPFDGGRGRIELGFN